MYQFYIPTLNTFMSRHIKEALLSGKQNLKGRKMTAAPRSQTNLTAATQTGDISYGMIRDAVIALDNGQSRWVGAADNLPNALAGVETVDMGGRLVTPELIDCHTHLVHGWNRAAEFEMRLNGASYEEVARAGGGIVSTVTVTRKASEHELLASALRRADALIAEGVTTLEFKPGCGLDVETELRILRIARAVMANRPIRLKTSFLGAHAVPVEYKDRADVYIDELCIPALREASGEGLVDAVDGFCESIAFSPAQIARVFDVAQDLGPPIKLHAEQLSNLGGAAMAASYGALSADHIGYLDQTGVQAMAKAGSVAVLLPGAFYTLHETLALPVQALRDQGVPIALATWDGEEPAELSYRIGFNPLHSRNFGAIQ